MDFLCGRIIASIYCSRATESAAAPAVPPRTSDICCYDGDLCLESFFIRVPQGRTVQRRILDGMM